jgi:hypothetical protein
VFKGTWISWRIIWISTWSALRRCARRRSATAPGTDAVSPVLGVEVATSRTTPQDNTSVRGVHAVNDGKSAALPAFSLVRPLLAAYQLLGART